VNGVDFGVFLGGSLTGTSPVAQVTVAAGSARDRQKG
jgi:hypothetical protein